MKSIKILIASIGVGALLGGAFFFHPIRDAHAKPDNCGAGTPKGQKCCSKRGTCLISNGNGTFSAANNSSTDDCGCGFFN